MSFAFAIGIASVFCWAGLASWLWRFRPAPPIWPVLFWSAIACLCWSTGELGTAFLAHDVRSLWPWLLVLYSGVLFSGPLWWSLALRFAGQHGSRPAWASARVEWAPFFLALACWIALVTNPWHGAFLEPVWEGRNVYRGFWYVQATNGYACLVASVALFARARRAPAVSSRVRRQLGLLLAATLLPLAVNVLYVTRTVETRTDPTVLGLAVGLVLVLAGMARESLFAPGGVTLDHWLEHEVDGVAITDVDGRLVRTNHRARELLGVGPLTPGADFLASVAARLEEPSGRALDRETLLAAMVDGESAPEGRSLRHRGDRERGIRLSSMRVPGGWASGDRLVLRLRDETELHRATERVARQASSIEAILASIQDGLLVVDAAGQILYANDRFWTLWRLGDSDRESTNESAILERLGGIVKDGPRLADLAASVPRTTAAPSGVEIETRDDRVLAVSTAPLLHGREATGRVWSFRDVSDRRRAEDERRRIDERMRESQKLESLGVLAGGIAHDFNNILVGILGNVDLAAQAVDPDSSASHHLGSVKRSADRAAELIHQLLCYAGRSTVATEPFDLSGVVEETLSLVRTAVSKKAELHCDLASDLAVQGDPVQLRQIVMNLMVNASDALGGRAGVITLRTGAETFDVSALEDVLPAPPAPASGRKRYAFLEITDTGCGMDAATLARIFEPFYSTKHEGRGLGLSTALGILRSHEGLIRVRSAPGRGTTFVLLLPFAEANAPKCPPRKSYLPPRTSAPGTVLVVDDEEAVRNVAQASLELGGFRVLLAKDGQEAVALFRDHAEAIDVIVLDLTMPRMDGAEALFAIRQMSRDTPVVFSSGYSEQDTMSRCAGLPGVSFVHKPYTAQGLVAKVREAAGSPRPATIATPAEGAPGHGYDSD